MNRSRIGLVTTLLLGAAGVRHGLSAEVAPDNRTPYISTYYIQPTVNLGDPAIIDYYVTDFDHKEYLDDDTAERFVIDYWVNGVKGVLKDVPAGDRSLNLGVLPKGNVLFAFQATDRLGIKSHRLYHEFRVVDPAEEAIQPGQVLYPDLAAFNISSNDTEPVATTAGLTALIKWASTNGYRKVVLPPGRYRIHESNTVQMASGVTLDLNGSTFKQNPNALGKTLLLEITGCVDAHVVNGILEGDLLEHDFANAPNNSEWLRAISISLGSSYCSAENLVVTNVTGYGTCCVHEQPAYVPYRQITIGDTFTSGDIDGQGLDIPSGHRTTSSNYLDIRAFTNALNFIYLGLGGGYLGNPAGHWVFKAHFYDVAKQHLESIEGYLYRRLYLPPNACYARFTLYSTSQPTDLTVCNRRSPYNCAFRNIRHVNVRCVGMALAGMNNMLVEGCRFDNCGWASATCAFDAEDGWDLMQDLTFRNNVFGDNPRNEFLTCAGHNFVMENNIMKAYMWDRSKNFVFRENTLKSAVYHFGSRLRSGYSRIAGNDNQGKATLILDTSLPDKRHYVRDESYTNGVAGPTGGWLGFRRCAITGAAMNAHAVQCSILNVTNIGGVFGIVDSVVSNSYFKQSQLNTNLVQGSTLVNSVLNAQGGSIVAESNHLIDTDCVIGSSWLTNCAFELTGNRIDTSKPGLITVGNSFKHLLLRRNVVGATHPDFNVVTLANPNFSAVHPDGTMLVHFQENQFDAAGGNVLKVNLLPNAHCTLFANFHSNVYNNIALHTANIAGKTNILISILPDVPTTLAVTLGTDIIAENTGAGAMTVTVTRYLNTAGALTVYLSSSDPTLFSVPSTVVIPAGQTSVTFNLDTIDNADQTGHQTATVTATADGFTAGAAALTVHDDELASLILVAAASPLPLAEGASTNYTVALGTVPAAPVTVTPVPQAPLLVSPASLTFSAVDWNIPQTVTIAYPDDSLADPPRLLAIGHSLAGADAAYVALAVDPLAVAVSDNDLSTLTLTAAAATLSEAAGNAATTVTLSRNTPATNALSVVMASSHPETVRIGSPATLPLGEVSIELAVDVLDDATIEPDVPVTLSAAAAGFAGAAVLITVLDDDTLLTAPTNAVPYAESFETLPAGAPLLPARGWYAAYTQDCTVVQETYAYAAPLPLDATHTKVAALNGPVVNRLVRLPELTWFDMMVAPRLGDRERDDLGEHYTGLLFSENGQLRLFHRDLAGGTNRWTSLDHSAIATNSWVRLTMGVDYATVEPAYPGLRFLRLFLDGVPILSGQALTDNRGGGEPGGCWFAFHPRPEAGILELGFQDGPCRLDDLVVTPRAPSTPAGTAWPWLADHGLTLAEESSDHDRDGYTAGEEYVADTDPCDAGSRFMIRAIDPSPPALRLGVPSAAGRLYTVERREAPGGGDWRPVPPWIDVPGTGAMLWLPATNGLPAGFFRARVRLAD